MRARSVSRSAAVRRPVEGLRAWPPETLPLSDARMLPLRFGGGTTGVGGRLPTESKKRRLLRSIEGEISGGGGAGATPLRGGEKSEESACRFEWRVGGESVCGSWPFALAGVAAADGGREAEGDDEPAFSAAARTLSKLGSGGMPAAAELDGLPVEAA